MGYETSFRIDVGNTHIDPDKILQALERQSGYDGWFDFTAGVFSIDAKWYDYDIHMKEVSVVFEDLVFQVDGDGEESGDTWRKYYKSGKVMDATPDIIYKEFDESKLE